MAILYIKNKINELNRIAAFVETIGAENNFSVGDIFDLNLAIDEICTNIIHYAELKEENSIIKIELLKNNNWVTIEIMDEGIEFNPLDYKTYDLNLAIDDRPIGNLGILLVKSKMDEVKYERKENKNILTMKKKLES